MQFLLVFLVSLLQLLSSTNEVEILFAGDAMQHEPQIKNAKRADGTYDYSKCFELVSDDIKSADWAIVNLECPLGGAPYVGYPCFSAPDEYATALKDAGFDLFLAANNHTLDRRDKGARRTISKLNELEMPFIGLYDNKAERDTISPYIQNIKGFKIAFLGYTYGTNGIPVQTDLIVDHIDRKKISEDIKKSRMHGAEVICVILHWGDEYNMLPNKSQKLLAEFLMEEGVDMIIGGHPHVIQPFELKENPKTGKNTLLVYSLGNFISNQNDTNCRGGAIVKAKLKRENGNVSISSANYNMVFVQKPTPAANYFQLIPTDSINLINATNRLQFDGFVRNARNILDKHNINVPKE